MILSLARVFGFSVLALFALAACGGGGGGSSSGGGGGGGGGGTITRAALTLNNTTSDEKSQLIGTMVAAPTGQPLEIRIVNATLDHSPGDIEGLSIVGGASGGELLPTATGWASEDMTLTNALTGSFIFSRVINLTTDDGPGPMIIGVIAPGSVMSNTGSTTFTGTAFVTGAVLDNTHDVDATGVSTITVDWAGTVDTRIVLTTNDEPFDTVMINGMTRSGARFEGGTVVLLDGSDEVTFNMLGANRDGAGSGGIFGALADNSDPAEAGGVFLTTGDSGVVGGGFIANWESSN